MNDQTYDVAFAVVANALIPVGRWVVVQNEDKEVLALDFWRPLFTAVFGRCATPWRYTWAELGELSTSGAKKLEYVSHVICTLDRETGQTQVFDRRNMPFGIPDGPYPTDWIALEQKDRVLIAKNCISRVPQDDPANSGFHFFELNDSSFVQLNITPIPYLIWATWHEEGEIVAVGMTPRTPNASQVSDVSAAYTRGRPAIVRCNLQAGNWLEVGADLMRNAKPQIQGDFSFEAWLGTEVTSEGERILLGGAGRVRDAIFDALDLDGRFPQVGDYQDIALIAYPTGILRQTLQGYSFVCSVAHPTKTIFVLLRSRVDGDPQVSGYLISDLYVLDLKEVGLTPLPIQISGIDANTLINGNFRAAAYPNTGLFGAVFGLDGTAYIISSSDGILWTCLNTSTKMRTLKMPGLQPTDQGEDPSALR
jgi:hypothetical protein